MPMSFLPLLGSFCLALSIAIGMSNGSWILLLASSACSGFLLGAWYGAWYFSNGP